jgi:rod shape-determining protein MreC
MEYSPPPFFKRGPSLLTRFAFFSLLSVVLLVSDARFSYLYVLRQVVAVVVYPVQRLSAMPGELIARVGDFFVTAGQLQRENEQLSGRTAAYRPEVQSPGGENQHLRQLLGMRDRLPREFIAARILYAHRDLSGGWWTKASSKG